MSSFPDIPADGGRPPAPTQRKLSAFQQMLKQDASRLNYNAYVYANRRASKDWVSTELKKIVIGAQFVPAHESRYEIGAYFVPKYFVVHRPGDNPTACTLLNTIREFSWMNRKASAHFVIGLNGELIQMVDLNDVALHCGTTSGIVNSNSVGAELEGAIGTPFTPAQLTTLASVLALMRDAYGLTLDRAHIVGHSEIHPKKADPGSNFPYEVVINNALLYPVRPTVFLPPFDARNTIQRVASEVLLEASKSHSRETRALLASASSQVNARLRAVSMRYSGRAEIATAAAEHNQLVKASQEMDLAYKLHAEDVFEEAKPTPQTNVAGLLFNFETGLWNDT